MIKRTCYMCGQPKTSVEHVPPRCLFPQTKDLPKGVNLRKQLITVPSCDLHNSQKSKDDEYLLYTLLLNIPNNQTAENHFFKKALRGIERNSSLIEGITKMNMPVTAVDNVTGEVHRTIAVKIDEKRLHSSLQSIGYALYYHHFGKPWSGTVQAYPHFLIHLTEPDARDLNAPNERMQQCTELLMEQCERFGDNPEVFCYQLAEGNDSVDMIMYLRIYEGSRATLMFKNG
ncbi:hypothetical protein [Thioalkalivibrio sp. ALE20]|uniref:hypothetical protein n=1 Tax=Thioalkalivibrio sp. ALE20 TaxID=545275 RepID=UPI0012E9E685|nr:hypothetical protein [Thioalkalivibrio sp. ALE20]